MKICHKCREIFARHSLPGRYDFSKLLEEVIEVLNTENEKIRPHSSSGLPGGVLILDKTIPTLVVPDLHARPELIVALLHHELFGENVEILLRKKKLQIVCTGDGLHSEHNTTIRWRDAYIEYLDDYAEHAAIDQEMIDGLGVMEMVFLLKREYPESFHFLKGNHENILNEEKDGNMPFRKKALEGAMVRSFFEKFYGTTILAEYATFEKSLPLLAIGSYFLVSHSEPERLYSYDEVIEYRDHPDTVFGLTWTPDGGAEEGSVKGMLHHYLEEKGLWYLGGHRNIQGLYKLRCDGSFVQIHNRASYQAAFLPSDRPFKPSDDIITLNI